MKRWLVAARPSLCARACPTLLAFLSGCSSESGAGAKAGASTGGFTSAGGGTGEGGATVTASTGGSESAAGGSGASTGGAPGAGGSTATGGTANDAGTGPSIDGGAARMSAGVNVHDYPKPTAYGFVQTDGKDRMGAALVDLGESAVRGGTIGDTAFLTRLHDFGVKEVILGLAANGFGKPFDPSKVAPALEKSLAVTGPLGMTVQVEGLNEWDLFHSKSYNAGVLPPGMTDAEFIVYTQEALYAAAHPLGVRVVGPSIGHPKDATSQAYFQDVGANVDIVNAHLYFTSNPESLDLPSLVAIHTRYQGTGKPVWVTETGISSYGSVTPAIQADVIARGLSLYAASGLIDRLYDYELLDDHLVGWDGTAFNVDNAEYHFGLYAYDGSAKPAATPFRNYISTGTP